MLFSTDKKDVLAADVTDDIFSGTLNEFALTDLLTMFSKEKRTGLLVIGDASEVWLDAGLIYLVKTSQSPPLTSALFSADAASLDELEEMFTSTEDAGTVTQQLVNSKPEVRSIIQRVLTEYNMSGLFELLVPSSNAFRFEPNRQHKLGSLFAVPSEELTAKAQKRLSVWKEIAAAVPSTEAIFSLTTTLPDGKLERIISSDEWQYLSRIDGRRTVASIVHETGQSAFRVCSTLYRLKLEGIISEKA